MIDLEPRALQRMKRPPVIAKESEILPSPKKKISDNPEDWKKSNLSKKEISRRTGFSYQKVRILMMTPEQKEERRKAIYGYTQKRKAQEYFVLKEKLERFKKRAPVNEDYNHLDLINHFGLNPICYLTGLPVDYNNSETYQLDHFIPVTKDGTSDLNNMRLAHPMANEMKRNYDFEKFLEICRLIAAQHPQN